MLKAIAAVVCLWAQVALPADNRDRRVAEWVLYMGGNVRLAGDPRTIQDLKPIAGRRLSRGVDQSDRRP